MLTFWAIAVGLVVWGANRTPGSRTQQMEEGEPALAIAGKRLARGEVTREQLKGSGKTLL